MKNSLVYFVFALFLILIDQFIKLWMHFDVLPNHFGEINLIDGVFKLHYVTNRGMAFGMELGGEYGKLVLTLFRLSAMFGISWYLVFLEKQKAHVGRLYSVAAILAGAIGNLIDSIFYGIFLNNAPFDSPFPLFYGQVIDMFYVVGLDGFWPDWVPYFGGTYNATPIFNFADASIFCGVVAILLFQKKFFEEGTQNQAEHTKQDDDSVSSEQNDSNETSTL